MDKRIIFLLGLMICVLLPAVAVTPSSDRSGLAQHLTKSSMQEAGSSPSSPVIVGFADAIR